MRRIIIPLGVLLTSAVLAAAPPPAKDPWTKVPKLPTACYSGQDRYFEEADAAVESIQQDLYRQDEVNDALIAKLDAIDGMEKQSRMQTFLMENPQEAMEYMKAVQETGSGIAGEVSKEAEIEQKFLDELKGIQAKYEAAIDKAQGPLWASLKALGISEMGTPQKTIDAGMVIMKKINAEYERVCPDWWGAAGPFHDWLKRYKEHLIQDRVKYIDKNEAFKVSQLKMFGVPGADTYVPTTTMDVAIRHIKQSRDIFAERVSKPRTNLILGN